MSDEYELEVDAETYAEIRRRVAAWNVLNMLLHKYGLTKVRKCNRFLGIKNGKALIQGDITQFDEDELIHFTGAIIGHVFLYGPIDD